MRKLPFWQECVLSFHPSIYVGAVTKNNNLFVKPFHILLPPTTHFSICETVQFEFISNIRIVNHPSKLFVYRCLYTNVATCVPSSNLPSLYSALPYFHDISCDQMRLLWCVCLSTLAVQTFCSCTAGTDRQTDGSPTDIRIEGHSDSSATYSNKKTVLSLLKLWQYPHIVAFHATCFNKTSNDSRVLFLLYWFNKVEHLLKFSNIYKHTHACDCLRIKRVIKCM